MPSLYAEHINRHLFDKKLDPLDKLRADPTIISQFKAKVTSDFFDPIGGRNDLHYAMSLLFVYEYFVHGPGYRANRDPLQISSLPVIESWILKLAKSNDDAQTKLAKYCFMTGGVFSPQGQASATVQDAQTALASVPAGSTAVTGFRQLLADVDHGSAAAGTIFDPKVLGQFDGVSRLIWNKWKTILDDQSPSTFWQAGIRSAQAMHSSSERPLGPFVGTLGSTVTTTIYAENLAAWCASRGGESYMSSVNVGQLKNTQSQVNPVTVFVPGVGDAEEGPPPGLTCFIAGTEIRTDGGSVPIELLREGDRVCTRMEPTQWGVRSCEVVKSPAPELIHGFNGGPAFFTAGHVFHTTTGLRALRPEIALAENPWLECGQLSIGDHLLRITPHDEYETVEIRSIDNEKMTGQYVYGVHLREGLRSYHANGYLVALNYPEITVSMVAKRLVHLPLETRVAILRSVSELQPLFERFGASTILDTLERESKTNNLSFGGKVQPGRPFLARDLDLPYVMYFPHSSLHGSQLELLHGVLYIDGKFCRRAAFRKRTLSWSRKLPDGMWEHAHCKFYNDGQQAFGNVIYHREQEEPDESTVAANTITFELTPGTLAIVQPPALEVAMEPTLLSAKVTAQTVSSARMAMKATTMASIVANTVETKTVARAATKKPVYFGLAYDPAIHDPTGKTTSNPNVRCGNILLPTEANRFAFGKLALDDYDQVRLKLTEKAKAETAQSSATSRAQFYKHTVRYDAREREHHKFELLQAQALIEASDEFPKWQAEHTDYLDLEPPVKDLHYTNLGLDASFVIKEVFKTIELEKGLPDSSGIIGFTGLARSYSSMAEGNEGDAHIIVATYVKPNISTFASAARRAISTAADNNLAVTSAHQLPHPLAQSLEVSSIPVGKEDRLQALADISLDLTVVNLAAQTTMTNVMQWHMKPEDRNLFFKAVDKPSGLPAELTTSIENTAEGNWIRDTYAMAYICQIMTRSDGQIRSEYRFTEKEKKNVEYFWAGNGSKCLSKSPVYRKLERAISRYELRQRYKIIDVIHKEGAGVEYSNALYERYTGPFTIDELPKINPTTGTSFLAKICTIMDALDDGAQIARNLDEVVDNHKTLADTNSNHLVVASMSSQKGQVWMAQYWGLKTDDERDQMLEDSWLEDTLRELVNKILAQDPAVTGPVAQALAEAMKKYSETVQGWANMSQKEKMQNIMIDMGDRIKDVMKCVGKMLGWVGKGAQAIWQKGRQIVAAWRNNGQALGAAVNHVLQEKPGGLVKGPLFGSLMFIVGMAAMGVTIWNASDKWSSANAADRGLMIMTILASLNQMAEFGVDAVYSIMRYKQGAFSEAAELAIHAEFDAIAQTNIGSKWASVFEDPLETGAMRIRELERVELRSDLFWEAGGAGEGEIVQMNKALSDLRDLAPIKRSFNIARSVIAIIGCVISIGLAIFMTWSLVNDWDKLDKTARIFQTLLVVLQWIEAAFALVVIGVRLNYPVLSTVLEKQRKFDALLTSNSLGIHRLGRRSTCWSQRCHCYCYRHVCGRSRISFRCSRNGHRRVCLPLFPSKGTQKCNKLC